MVVLKYSNYRVDDVEIGNDNNNTNQPSMQAADNMPQKEPYDDKSTYLGIKEPESNSGKLKHYLAATALVVILLLLIILVLHNFGIYLPLQHITNATTSSPISINESSTYLGNFSFNTKLKNLGTFVYRDTYCNYTEYFVDYAQKGVPVPPGAINFSTLNTSEPIFVSFGVENINGSLGRYLSIINGTGGYCQKIFSEISKNSLYSKSSAKIDGINAYIMNFSNFTNAGLNLTQTYYIGPKPNLEWQITKVVYKNVALVTSVWWFEGKANNTALYNYSSNFYSRFISEAAK